MRIKNFTSSLLLSIFLLGSLSGTNAQALRIMPLGNSITAGSMCLDGTIYNGCNPMGGHIAVGYRQRLLSLLSAAGYNIDFVGTETFGNALMSDSDCAGFGGISDGRLADIMETGSSSHTGWVTPGPYMNTVGADVVLLHIGTNDVLAGDVNSNDVDRILNAIDAYESSHGTSVMVFLARIISTRTKSCNTDPNVVAYNQMMDQLAATRIANDDQLILVDMECGAGLDYNNDMMDEVHPNQNGYDKMGQAWFNAIASWMDPPSDSYTLTMETPEGNGSVSPSVGSHNYPAGTNVNLSASPSAGYAFSSWTGDLLSTANPAQINMNGNKTVKANFSRLSYKLYTDTDGTSGAAISPWGVVDVDHGAATGIEVTVIPEGYQFDGWEIVSGSSVSIEDQTALSTTVTLESGNAVLHANFSPVSSHTLTVSVQGEGQVDINPEQESYPHNSTVELTAIAETGSTFTGWSGSLVSTANPVQISMNGNKTVKANFSKLSYKLYTDTDGTAGAAISPWGVTDVEHGTATGIEVTVIPEGYQFDGWEIISGSSVSIEDQTALSTTVNLESGNAVLHANFSPVSSHTLTVSVQGEGQVDINPEQESYLHNSPVELTAIAESGYTFTGWSGDLEGNENPANLVMNGNKNVTATFSMDPYTLTVLSDGTEGVELSPEGSVFVELGVPATVEVKTIPIDYVFNTWELVSGSLVRFGSTSEPTTTVTLEGGDATIRAKFERKIEVLEVDIPDESFIIGDTVWTEIGVKDNQGNQFELVSGTIGGYKLEGLQGLDSVTYKARFTVTEGGSDFRADEDIPVTGLILGDGQAKSQSFDALISQDNDPIDANAPVILSMTVPSAEFLTGDTIKMSISADGADYQAISGSINGVDLESGRLSFIEKGEGDYQLSYTIAEEDSEVASGELGAMVQLRDAAGNPGTLFTQVQDNTLVIKIGTATGKEGSVSSPSFYPNPAQDYLVLIISEGYKSARKIEIVDMTGRVRIVREISEKNEALRIGISDLESGAYVLRMVDNTGNVWTAQLMKSE